MRTLHPFVRIVGGLALCGLMLFTFAGAAFISAGTIYVSVHDKGSGGMHLTLPVPVNLASAALALVPGDELEDVRAEIGPWLPAAQAVLSELSRCPDGPLVAVESDGETVTVVKRGGVLVVDVDGRDETVHLSVPIRGVGKLLKQLGPVDAPSERAHGQDAAL